MRGPALKVVRPEPVFIGCCYKQMLPRPDWLVDPRVVNIASVSTCMAARPKGWVERWDFNAAGYYNSPEQAAAVLAASGESGGSFQLLAYEFFPMRFDAYGGAVEVAAESVFDASVGGWPRLQRPEGHRFIGYDPVQRWAELQPGRADGFVLGGGFGCSPLSCNNRSKEHPVNEHCLLSEWDDAVAAARRFAVSQGAGAEGGCYYVFGVYADVRASRAAAP